MTEIFQRLLKEQENFSRFKDLLTFLEAHNRTLVSKDVPSSTAMTRGKAGVQVSANELRFEMQKPEIPDLETKRRR